MIRKERKKEQGGGRDGRRQGETGVKWRLAQKEGRSRRQSRREGGPEAALGKAQEGNRKYTQVKM